MSKAPKPFNPGSFEGALTEALYAVGWERGTLTTEQDKLVAVLRTKHKDDDTAQALADKLETCRKDSRCKSGACPECARAGQVLFAKSVSDFLSKDGDGGSPVCISIVPADGTCKPGQLAADYARRNVRRWKERLGRAGVTWFIGALDYSLNEHDEDRYKPHWSEHLYGLASTNDVEGLKRELLKQFPVTDAIPRPVKVTEWDGGDAALNYLLKPNAWRRVATDDAERFDKEKDEKRSCRATDKQRLKSKQRVRLALHLDEIGLSGRLVLRWAQFVNYGATTTIAARAPRAVGPSIVNPWSK